MCLHGAKRNTFKDFAAASELEIVVRRVIFYGVVVHCCILLNNAKLLFTFQLSLKIPLLLPKILRKKTDSVPQPQGKINVFYYIKILLLIFIISCSKIMHFQFLQIIGHRNSFSYKDVFRCRHRDQTPGSFPCACKRHKGLLFAGRHYCKRTKPRRKLH